MLLIVKALLYLVDLSSTCLYTFRAEYINRKSKSCREMEQRGVGREKQEGAEREDQGGRCEKGGKLGGVGRGNRKGVLIFILLIIVIILGRSPARQHLLRS